MATTWTDQKIPVNPKKKAPEKETAPSVKKINPERLRMFLAKRRIRQWQLSEAAGGLSQSKLSCWLVGNARYVGRSRYDDAWLASIWAGLKVLGLDGEFEKSR